MARFKKEPVSGTVAIIRRSNGIIEAEKGKLLTNGRQLDGNAVATGDTIIARLNWTEGQGLETEEQFKARWANDMRDGF